MMKALSLMHWLVSWGHCLILETRLWRTLVDGPAVVLERDRKLIKELAKKKANGLRGRMRIHLVASTDPSRDFHYTPGVVAALPDDYIQFVIPETVL